MMIVRLKEIITDVGPKAFNLHPFVPLLSIAPKRNPAQRFKKKPTQWSQLNKFSPCTSLLLYSSYTAGHYSLTFFVRMSGSTKSLMRINS
jgi:hypothetical protein